MFTKSIDEKNTYIDQNGVEVVDIGESFMDVDGQNTSLYAIYKVPKDMEMRPDKISLSAYGSDEYTEMVCVFNNIKNPFTIEENDIVYMISLNNIYDNTYEPISEIIQSNKNNGYEIFRRFLDKSRLPKTIGSERNNSVVGKSTNYKSLANKNILSTNNILPPNIAAEGANPIEKYDGKITYGTNTDAYIYGTPTNGSNSSKISPEEMNNYNKGNSRILDSINTSYSKVNTIVSDNANNNLSDKSNTLNNALSSSPSFNSIDNIIDNLSSKIENIISNNEINGQTSSITNINSSNQNQISNNNFIYDNNGNLVKDIYDNNGNLIKDVYDNNGNPINDINSSNIYSPKYIKNLKDSSSNNTNMSNNVVSFGRNSSIGCAQDGFSTGEFMTKKIKNSI